MPQFSPERIGTPRVATHFAWTFAVILFAWLTLYPLLGGLVVANDDLKFIRGDESVGKLAESLRFAWLHTQCFRPLEIIVAFFCDARTLSCWPVPLVQLSGLLTIVMGVIAVTRRVLPSFPIAAPLVLIWIFLSPSTMSSLWQMDTGSQTWSTALGLWCAILSWDIFVAAHRCAKFWKQLIALFVLAAIGMNVKETYFGWSFAIGVGWTIASLSCWRKDFGATLRSALALIPTVLIPLIYVVIRYKFGGLIGSSSIESDLESRYQISLSENLFMNASMSMFGMFLNGPLHLFNDEAAMLSLRALSPISLLAVVLMLLAATALRILHRQSPPALSLRSVMLAAGVCMLSVIATLPLGTVSDIYGFGPNIGSGLLIVTSGLMLWNPADRSDRLIGRAFVWCAALTLVVTGLYGVASRTYQFSMTWYYAREMNQIVLKHLDSLSPMTVDEEPAIVYFTQSCCSGHIYGQVMIQPGQSMGVETILPWLNRQYPKQSILFLIGVPSKVRPGIDLLVDCSKLAPRHDW